ncbi:MAG: hypothetical protein ABIR15_17795 [Chitinophagaceae bacterium]
MTTINANEKIGVLASRDARFARIFEQVGIKYLYTSDQTLEEASKEFGVVSAHFNTVADAMNMCELTESQDFQKWDIDDFTSYFINNYYWIARRNIRLIYNLAQTVVYKHSGQHPALSNLSTRLFLFFDDYLFQLKQEELILSDPAGRFIKKDCCKQAAAVSSFLKRLSSVLQNNADKVVNECKALRKITKNYLCPADSCPLYKKLYKKMLEFEKDLLFHVHLQNDILFPRMLELHKNSYSDRTNHNKQILLCYQENYKNL